MSEKKLIELHLHLDGSLRPETVWAVSYTHLTLPTN